MPTINISGAQPGKQAQEPALTPEQKTLKALYDKNMQAQLGQMLHMQKLRKASVQEELQGLRQVASAEEQNERKRERAMQQTMRGWNSYQKQKKAAEERETRQAERQDRQRQTAAEREQRNAVRQQERVERTERSRRHSNARGWAGAARMGGIAMAGVRGDIEGATTAIGTLLGSLGGPIGATIGAAAGEVLGKALKMAIEAPMLPGQAWQSYLSVSAPWMSLKSDAYSMARAGGYSGDASINSVLPPGSFGASQPEWMKLTGSTPESVLRSINATGINPRSQDEFSSLGQTLAFAGNTSAYSNLRPGQIEGLAGQGMGLGMTTPTDSSKFLGSLAPAFGEANAQGLDKSKLLSQIQETLDTIAKNGAAGISGSAVSEAFARFAQSGTPGGRSGADAAASLGGTSAALGNPLGSAPVLYGMQSVANSKYHGLRTEADIRGMIGEKAFAANSATPGGAGYQSDLIKQIQGDVANQNMPAALDKIGELMQADPTHYQRDVRGMLKSMGMPDTPAQYTAANMTLQTRSLVNRDWHTQDNPGATAPNGYDDQMAGQRFLSGTGDDADTARSLKNMGVPDAYIPMVMDAAKKTGQDPAKIAAIMWHESRFKANAFNRNANGTSDYGLMQTNDRYAAGDMAAAGITSSELAANAAGGALDPQKAIMAGAMHLRASDGDLVKYGGDNPTGRAAAAQEQDYISHHLTQNIPTDVNEAQAMGGAAVDTGAKDMFMNLNSAMKTVSSEAESAAVGINKLAAAIRGLGDTGVNVKGPSEANNNWDAAGGNKISPVEMRTQHFHVQQ